MSELQDDKKVLEGKREKAQLEVSVRDKIVRDLYNKLDDQNISLTVNKLWHSAMADKSEWLDKQRDYLSSYDEFIDVEPQGLFETSSNLHVPVTLWTSKTYHARFLQTLIGPEPSISVKARQDRYYDVEQDIEDFMKYTMMEWANNYRGVEESVDTWVWQWVTAGIGYMKVRWDKKYQKYVDVVETEEEGPEQFVLDPQSGEEIAVPTSRVVEVESEVRKEVFNGPVVENVNFEDLVVIGEDITDIDGADAVIHRHWVTASDLWTFVDRGIFDRDAVEEIINGGDITKSGAEGSGVKQERLQGSGEASLDKEYDLDRYEILEAYLSVDVDGSGINSDVIVWTDTKSRQLLRTTYLHRVSKSGRRPFSAICFHKRGGDNKHMPVGLVEMLYSIQREIDAIHNMRIDFGIISSMPFGFYRASSSIDPKDIKIEPGTLIPVDDPRDVVFPNLGNRTIFGLQEESQLYVMVERLTGISDLSLGSMSGRQGATRTATGTRALMAESNTNLNVPLMRLNRGWKRLLEMVLDQLQERTPKGMQYRVPGGDGFDRFMTITGKHDLAGDYAIEVSPESSSSNPAVRMENAQQVLQLSQNPLLVQLGVVTPQNIYEAVKNYMKAIGVKEHSRFINAEFANQYVLTPKEEFERVVALTDVPVLPNGDHEGFIAFVENVFRNDDQLGELTQQQVSALQLQVSKHKQMMQAMQQMQAQQANTNQQVLNAQQGAQANSNPAGPVGNIQGSQGGEQ